ncbi:MAG TPA: sn-glycerol-1-phosphate dehydrogenase, partial [Candidatus Binatia bacterium]|nr:sn-glycerol-1-phosphate dehydrogenase [Candidatus Binatia bacterium]
NGCAPSHGFKVGIGTLAVTALYECLLEQPLDQLDVERCCAAWRDNMNWDLRLREFFNDPELLRVAIKESRAKTCAPEALRLQLQRLRSRWPQLRESLRKQLLPRAELERRLKTVGAPVSPEQIGITRLNLRQSFWQALFIRRRFTVLDLALRAGLLDNCLGQLFGARGVWPVK